ncbi:methyltransferase-like protein 7A [Acanthaster planci]|uniref:Methyltransferase-like protein 7A n=1 Tax=Acanthaster planci TaxID=133434 RepID=A0A8B7XWU6_ACAPL|nr:methyltransferase-like protein 7A [Acanthaster planci]
MPSYHCVKSPMQYFNSYSRTYKFAFIYYFSGQPNHSGQTENRPTMYEYGVLALLLLGGLLVLNLLVKTRMHLLFPAIQDRCSIMYNVAAGGFKRELFKDMETLRDQPLTERAGDAASGDEAPRSLTVLEIGVGTGANFEFYPDGTAVIGVEPNKNFVGYLERNAAKHFPRVRLERTVVAFGEDLRGHVDDCSVDAVVITVVLCSVKCVDAVLSEARRVLKQGGKLFFLEHVAAEPGTWINQLQWVLNPIWPYIFDGCQLIRTPWVNVERAGFSKVDYQKLWIPVPFFVPARPHLMGVATK